MYKMDWFGSFTANAWKKNDAEVIEKGGEIWINPGHLQEKLDLSNISHRTQYYSDKFLKKWDAKYNGVEIFNLVECLFKIFYLWLLKKDKQLFSRQNMELINLTTGFVDNNH